MSTTPFQPIDKQRAAQILGQSPRTIEYWVQTGFMPQPAHIGRRAYWHPDAFYLWLNSFFTTDRIAGLPATASGETLPVVGQDAATLRKPARGRPRKSGNHLVTA